ncbi:MAG: preprotein translocase subunit SecG [Chloroflexota bacterium]
MTLQPWAPYLSIIEIILGLTLTVLVVVQAKGSDLGGFMGGGGADLSAGFRTRRGVEATLHNVTIVIAVLFFLNTFFSFLAWGQIV